MKNNYNYKSMQTLKPLIAAILVVFPPLMSHAATGTPNSGAILQQIKPAKQATPSSSETGLVVEKDRAATPAAEAQSTEASRAAAVTEDATPTTAETAFLVNKLQITGNKKIDTATLHALVAEAEGKKLTLTDLSKLAASLTDYYRSHGYPVAIASIPKQTVTNGIVRIEINFEHAEKNSTQNKNTANDKLLANNTAAISGNFAKYPMLQLTQPNVPFVVNAIRISGNIQVKTALLHELVAGNEGQTLTLIELRERIAIITDYYRKHGFPLAHAVIPGQLVKGGIVDVQIIKMRPTEDAAYDFSGEKQQTLTPVAPAKRLASVNNARPMLQLTQPNTVFLVKTLRITGNIKVGTAVLHALVADSEGKRLNLVQLRERIGKITDYYKDHGFQNAHAIIPGQVIKSGVVEVQIVAMRGGKDTEANASAAVAPIYNELEPVATAKPAAEVSDAPPVAAEATPVAAEAVADPDFLVNSIIISGNKNIATPILHALVAEAEGKKLVIATLYKLVGRITDYYHNHGYPLARAVIPAQTISNGIVNVQVYEANYGKIELNNTSRVKNPLLVNTLSSLQPGDVIAQAKLDHALLLLSDIPGVVVNSTLKPGEAVGTSDLQVNTSASQRVYGNVVLDNYGNGYTGRPRIGGTVNVIDPLGLGFGDTLSLSGLSSGGGLNYGRAAYESMLNQYGTRMGGSYSALHYKLGGTFKDLNAQGNAQVLSIWAKHPLIRSRDLNLYGQAKLEHLKLNDHVGTTQKTDRNLNNASLNITGDTRDTLLSGGINTWDLGITRGNVDFSDANALISDAATAKTNGSFSKLNVNLSRLQSISADNALYVSLAAQVAGDNLDSSQKMSVGGPYTVRAYDTGAVSGDTGYLVSAELRHDLGALLNGQVHVLGFVDTAHITVNKNNWGTAKNSATLSGVGVGLNWVGQNNFNANAYIATPIGATPSLVTTNSTRAWVEIGKRF